MSKAPLSDKQSWTLFFVKNEFRLLKQFDDFGNMIESVYKARAAGYKVEREKKHGSRKGSGK